MLYIEEGRERRIAAVLSSRSLRRAEFLKCLLEFTHRERLHFRHPPTAGCCCRTGANLISRKAEDTHAVYFLLYLSSNLKCFCQQTRRPYATLTLDTNQKFINP